MQFNYRREFNIRRKVLIVDDEIMNRNFLGDLIGKDFDVLYAENGVQALEVINAKASTLSLVLLDLEMPVMSGFDLLEVVHKDDNLKHLPVIALTNDKKSEVKSLQLGAVDVIQKPYDLPELITARIHRTIELAEDTMLLSYNERDSLTGLYAKGFFLQYVAQHDLYNVGDPMDAVVININRFHLVNELYGRAYGRYVLKTIADWISYEVGKYDGLACRCDPDTFYLYIPHCPDYEIFMEKFTKYFCENTGNQRINIRVGVDCNVDRNMDVEQRYERASLACNRMRHSYQNSVTIYNNDIHEKEVFRERLIMEMDSAMLKGQFKVFYQPKYAIAEKNLKICGAEALVRWVHPDLGIINPTVFVPLFEENGLIQKLDRFVWAEAAVQIRKWRDKYGKVIPVSVNVSRVDITCMDLVEELQGIIKANSLDASTMVLEITESAYTDNSDQMIETVSTLRKVGFRVEMDDFGSGYSSLNMLASLPIDALKLDMEFVKKINNSEKDLQMVKLVIDIARFLKIPVIAEGVELENQYQALKDIGCDVVQGFYLSRPIPPEIFEKLVENEEQSNG